MTPEELEAAIEAGDPERVIALLAGATEAERRSAAERVRVLKERMHVYWYASEKKRRGMWSPKQADGVEKCLPLADAGTGGRPELYYAWHQQGEAMARVLIDRRPGWLAGWAEEALRRFPGAMRVVRPLIRAGLVPLPDPEIYVPGLISAGHPDGPWGLLRDDPQALAEVWLLFEYEGNRDASLTMADDGKNEAGWTRTLIRLSETGTLSRDRLLDASLDALARDFAQFRAGWFTRFHEALAPTVEEREARLDRYLALLTSSIPPTVSFSVRALAALAKAKRLPGALLLDHAAPALAAREKGTVTATLKLLAGTAKREPALAARAAEVACAALLHEAPEVQGAALLLIEQYGDRQAGELRSLLQERAGDVAASQRSRVEALLGAAPEPATSAAAQEDSELEALLYRARALPSTWRELAGIDAALADLQAGTLRVSALDLPFHGVPRLDPEAEIPPVEALDDLIETLARLLETHGPPEEVERALDGLSRLCAERPDDFDRRVGPLRKRAGKLFDDAEWMQVFRGYLRQDLSALVLAWTTGELKPQSRQRELDLDSFHGLRLWELAQRVVARKPRPLLALPTHAGGWIDPRVMVERVRAAGREWDLADAVQALLRLAPDHRAEALGAAAGLDGELGDALRHALGAGTDRSRKSILSRVGIGTSVGKTAALWAAAARARSPREDDPVVEARHPGLGPDAGRAARLSVRVGHKSHEAGGKVYHFYPVHVDLDPPVPKKLHAELPTVLHHVKTEGEAPGHRWGALTWPAGRHAWFGRGVEAVGGNLDWWEAEWTNRVYLEALLEPDTPLCETGVALLALALGAKEPGESGLGVDALIASVSDGRLDGARLGSALAALGGTGLIKAARWAKSLGEGARASALHREVVRTALEALLAGAPELRPVDLGAVLTLTHELCVESASRLQDERARVFVGGIKGEKTGAAAKALLALEEGSRAPHLRAAAAEALRGRLERAERWLACMPTRAPSARDAGDENATCRGTAGG
ncbi:MAG: DUF6493 family protein [Armatimonadota bacterium]